MAMPDPQTLMRPALQTLADGAELRVQMRGSVDDRR